MYESNVCVHVHVGVSACIIMYVLVCVCECVCMYCMDGVGVGVSWYSCWCWCVFVNVCVLVFVCVCECACVLRGRRCYSRVCTSVRLLISILDAGMYWVINASSITYAHALIHVHAEIRTFSHVKVLHECVLQL